MVKISEWNIPADTKHMADYAIGKMEIERRMAHPENYLVTNLIWYLRIRKGP